MNTRQFIARSMLLAMAMGAAVAQPVSAETFKVYAAAVVKTPLTELAAAYEQSTGNTISLVFDTAGATAQKFEADSQAALLITTLPLIRSAESAGNLRDGVTTLIGSTAASIAVPPSAVKPDVSTPEKFKAALLAAKRIAVSDPARGATVGTHFMRVIETLGIKSEIQPKITFAADGFATMRLVLEEGVDVGVSQSSEILQANPRAMAGPFPKEFALVTDFALWRRSQLPPALQDFVTLLLGPTGREKLAGSGITPLPRN